MARGILRTAGIVGAFSLSGFVLVLAFHEVEWAEIRRARARANHSLVFLGAMIGLGGFVVRAFGWKFLLAPVGQVNGWRLFSPVAIGYMANNLLPARLGEFARAYVVGRRENFSKSAALATIMIERIFDGLILLLILATVSIFFPFAAWVKQSGIVVAAAFLFVSLCLALVALKSEWVAWGIDAILGPILPGMAVRMKSRLQNFVVGLDFKNHYPTVALAFVFTGLRWAFEACIYFSVILALGLQDQVPIHGALFVMVAVNIACMIPQAPGFVGSVQIACIQALAVFGVDRDTAVAYSLLVHAAFFFPITLVGIFCLAQSRFSFTEISRGHERAGWGDSVATPTCPPGKQKLIT
jgi:uncharacterized protein (TIRG00374 family)